MFTQVCKPLYFLDATKKFNASIIVLDLPYLSFAISSALGSNTDNTFFLSIAPSAGPEPDKRPYPLFVVADEEPLGLNLNR